MAEPVTPLLLAAEVMLASVALSSVMLYFLHRSRQQLKALQRRLDDSHSPPVEQFLQRETNANQRLLHQPAKAGDRERLLALLRGRWLQAEQAALVEHGRRGSDVSRLQQVMTTVLTMLEQGRAAGELVAGLEQKEPQQESQQQAEPQGDATAAAPTAPANVELKKARATIDLQRKTIQDLRNLIALYRQRSPVKPEEAAGAAKFDANLQAAEGHTDALQQSMGNLERMLDESRENYRQACEQIKTLQSELLTQKGRPLGEASVLVVEQKRRQEAIAEARDFLSGMEDVYQQSSGELTRLQDTNRRQRELIMQMEKEIGSLRKGAAEQEASQTLLDQLKLQLRDYEMCTITLEAETESMRERLQTLNGIIERAEKHSGSELLEQMQQEISGIAQLKNTNLRQQHLLEMLQRVALAAEPEQASAQLMTLLREWRMEAVLLLKTPEDQLWFSTAGAVDRRDKQLLQGMTPTADKPWLDTKDGTLLLYPCCRLLLRGEPLTGNERETMQQWLLGIAPALDSLMVRLLRQRHSGQRMQQVLQQCKTIRKPLTSIEVQNRYLLEESARVLETFRTELNSYLGNIEITAVQRQILEDMFKDFEARMHMLGTGNTAARKSLLQVMQGLDALTTEH